MSAGVPPIRALKARYYADARFTARLLPPPATAVRDTAHRPADDWTVMAPVAALEPPAAPAASSPPGTPDAAALPTPAAAVSTETADPRSAPDSATSDIEARDTANAGIRREPELGEHEEVVPQPPRAPVNEFAFDTDEPEAIAARKRRGIERAMARTARAAALDPDDGVAL